MAFLVLANCSSRYALPNATLLYHSPYFDIKDTEVTYEDAISMAARLKYLHNWMVESILELYPIDRKTLLRHMKRETKHRPKDLNAALKTGRKWISVVDDVKGLSTLVAEPEEAPLFPGLGSPVKPQ